MKSLYRLQSPPGLYHYLANICFPMIDDLYKSHQMRLPTPGTGPSTLVLRQLIETVSGKLLLAFRLATDRLHPLLGFRTRLAAKIGWLAGLLLAGSRVSEQACLVVRSVCSLRRAAQP